MIFTTFDNLRLAGGVFQFLLRHHQTIALLSQQSTTVMLYLLINRTPLFIICSQCSMLGPDLFMKLIDLTTSLISCVTNFISCELMNVSTLNCAFWSTKLFMNFHWITLLKCVLVGSIEAHRCLRSSTAGNLIVPQQIHSLVNEHIQSLLSSFGTIYQSKSGHQHLLLHSKRLSKLVYLLNHIIR